jgi:hypothetical protein
MIEKEANFNELPKNRIHRSIWLLFEYPHSSILARIIAIISVVVVVVSITLFCVETIPEVRARRQPANQSQPAAATSHHLSTSSELITNNKHESASLGVAPTVTTSDARSPLNSLAAIISTSATTSTTTLTPGESSGDALQYVIAKGPVRDEFFILETICIVWFSIELVMRLYSSPDKLKFIKQLGNIIDFFSILPYFMEVTDISAKFSILRIIRLVRVFRIFKLARHFKGLQILAHTLKASLNELILLVFFLVIGVVLFSSIVYFLELEGGAKSDFHSIPDGFWYAIIVSSI